MTNSDDALKDPKYDILVPILDSIFNECVKMDEEETKLLKEQYDKVINTFVNEMRKTEKDFKQFFSYIVYTGSYYDGLRVGEATEFDLNLKLNLPVEMYIEKVANRPGFVDIKVRDNKCEESVIENWVKDKLLYPSKIKRWLEGVATKTLSNLDNRIDGCRVTLIKSGPALTLKVKSNKPPFKDISIDLVPVIEFPPTMWPAEVKNINQRPWYAVPKGEDMWRMSFPFQEKLIIKSHNFLKPTLRLLKKVRDEFGMKQISSYYIKTLFLWEVKNEVDWTKHKGRLFVHMLIRFRDALKSRTLPFYWDEKCNLITQLSGINLENKCGRLSNFIQEISKLTANKQNKMQLECYIRKELKLPNVPQALTSSPAHGKQQPPSQLQAAKQKLNDSYWHLRMSFRNFHPLMLVNIAFIFVLIIFFTCSTFNWNVEEPGGQILNEQMANADNYLQIIQKLARENKQLKDKVTRLENRIEVMDQHSRSNCVVIQGVPHENNEDLVSVVQQVGEALNMDILDTMIDDCYRFGRRHGTNNKPAGIMVKFVRRLDKEDLLHKRKLFGWFSTIHMNLPMDQPIYIQESLTPMRRQLMAMARKIKREKLYKYLWTRCGKIFVRKDKKAPVIYVNCQADLRKL